MLAETVTDSDLLMSFAGSLVIPFGSRIASRSTWGRLSKVARKSALACLLSESSLTTKHKSHGAPGHAPLVLRPRSV